MGRPPVPRQEADANSESVTTPDEGSASTSGRIRSGVQNINSIVRPNMGVEAHGHPTTLRS